MASDNAESPVIGIIIVVSVVFILFLLLLLSLSGMLAGYCGQGDLAPPLIQVTSVFHTSQFSTTKNVSRIVIVNCDTVEYKNRDLMASFYRNGEQLYAVIRTLHGEDFIPTQHYGVKTIGGSGCSGKYFSPGEMIVIDLKDGYYRPGDLVELRIYQHSPDSSPAPITGPLTDREYMKDWLDENVYSSKKGYRLISQHHYTA